MTLEDQKRYDDLLLKLGLAEEALKASEQGQKDLIKHHKAELEETVANMGKSAEQRAKEQRQKDPEVQKLVQHAVGLGKAARLSGRDDDLHRYLRAKKEATDLGADSDLIVKQVAR